MNFNLWPVVWCSFAFIAGVQIFYYLFFFSRLAFYKKKAEPSQDAKLPLSVIICAKDEEANLSRNLPVVLQQRYGDNAREYLYEVIVVDHNSFDDSRHFLRSLQPGYLHFRTIELHQEAKGIPGKKYPLAIGLKGAANETVILTDADCKPSSVNWLQLMSEGFSEGKEIVLGYGPYNKHPGMLNKLIRFETFFSALQYLSFALAGVPYMGVGRNLAYKKELFFRHKGFLPHQHLPSGDDDLFINAAANAGNVAVAVDKQAFTYSEPKHSWSAWFRQKTRHFSTGKYYKGKHKFLLGLFSLTQFLFWPFFAGALFYSPFRYITLALLGSKLLVQAIIFFSSMKKLGEKDLFPFFWLFDIGMFIYYIIFTPALIMKPKKRWK